MHYLLFYDVVPDYAGRRVPLRAEHFEHARRALRRGELVLGGAYADPVDGALLLFKGDSPEVAAKFARDDPYVHAGLVTRWTVREWTTVAGRDAQVVVSVGPTVRRLDALPEPAALDPLVAASRDEGFGFLERLRADYESGQNRFDQPGEALFGVFDGERLIGVGGLNRDPFAGDPEIGRVRRLYIDRSHRGRGAGRKLVEAIVDEARGRFSRLALRTETDAAAAFYAALGFTATALPDATHELRLPAPRPPHIKICCIASPDEAALAIRWGASAIGLVSAMPSGPGPIDEAEITRIAAGVPPSVATFLLTCERDPAAILAQQERCGASTIQLVDHLEPEVHARLREALGGVRLVQVVHVTGPESVEYAKSVAPGVDALLLDSGNLAAPIKELGGTGRVHDWALSRRIRDEAGVSVFLAGGLNAANVAEAIRRVEPFGLDVCSGVRTDGRLDVAKLRAFVAAAGGRE